jgi:hypothetical protein
LGPVVVLDDVSVLGVLGSPTVDYLPGKGLADDQHRSDLTRFVLPRLPKDAVTAQA